MILGKEGVGAKPPPKKGGWGEAPSLSNFYGYITMFPTHNPAFPKGSSRLCSDFCDSDTPQPKTPNSHLWAGVHFFWREIWEAIFLTGKRRYMPRAEGARRGVVTLA